MVTVLVLLILVGIVLMLYPSERNVKIPKVDRKAFFSKAIDFYQGWSGKRRLKKITKEMPVQFRNWAIDLNFAKSATFYKGLPEAAAEFSAWASGMKNEEIQSYLENVSAYCESLNFKLAWLFDERVDRELRSAVEEAVLLYSLAFWKANQIQTLAAFKIWQDTPDLKKDTLFSQRVYSELLNAGMINPPPDLILASEKERQLYIIKAIGQAANENPKAFNRILKELAIIKPSTPPVANGPAPIPTSMPDAAPVGEPTVSETKNED